MASFLAVGRGPAPVLGEEQGEATAGRPQVVGRGVDGEELRIGGDPVVERADERFEERHAPDRLVQRDLGHGYGTSRMSPGGPRWCGSTRRRVRPTSAGTRRWRNSITAPAKMSFWSPATMWAAPAMLTYSAPGHSARNCAAPS